MSDTKNNFEDKSDEEVIDLRDNENYQVLSSIFETESGKNIADLLSKIQKDIHNIADNSYKLQKDIHLLATSVSKLIELSLKSQTES
jgi:hypothetical protein